MIPQLPPLLATNNQARPNNCSPRCLSKTSTSKAANQYHNFQRPENSDNLKIECSTTLMTMTTMKQMPERKSTGEKVHLPLVVSMCDGKMIGSPFAKRLQVVKVMYRYDERPEGEEGQDWRWNDQAQTYRPKEARYDPECGVVVEGFDHTCPWTGTAIGSRNMFWFRIFTGMVPICIAWSIVLRVLF
mmetsp:Transcript_21876/g.62345  ORF Transcript_21876/g.62345 Transcript_21876/m.62345 type:complete len:187 (-) Transcript_21876:277-837(-)